MTRIYEHPLDDQKEATRARILEAAESVFADKGYHDALVDEVAEATSLSKGGVYFHFPSKESLFFAVLDRLADRLIARAERESAGQPTALAGADAALVAVFSALSKRRRLAKLLMVQGYSMGNAFERKRAELFDRFAGVIRSHLDDAVARGEIGAIDTAVAAHIWLGASSELLIRWLYAGEPAPARALPLLRTMLIEGARAASGAGTPRGGRNGR
ncbi:MAG: TetR/AcrR family transcriptional regulator [Chloroflexi bacterium]|nr:TetR/AcrR family transcriptional regulator [Chloroflexota bacterium]